MNTASRPLEPLHCAHGRYDMTILQLVRWMCEKRILEMLNAHEDALKIRKLHWEIVRSESALWRSDTDKLDEAYVKMGAAIEGLYDAYLCQFPDLEDVLGPLKK